MKTKRIFVGIPLTSEVKEGIKFIYDEILDTEGDFSFVPLKGLHFTLKFLGDVEKEKITEIKQTLSSVKLNKFFVNLSGMGAFPSLEHIKVIWIGCEKLTELMKEINSLLSYVKKNDYEEKPHLTLARVKSAKNKELIKKLIENYKNKDFGNMEINKIVLYESILTSEGPIYSVLEEFPLS